MDNIIKEELKSVIMDCLRNESYVPLKPDELSFSLSVSPDDRAGFREAITELADKGRVIFTKKGKLMLPSSLNLVNGTFLSSAKGYGFVKTEDPKEGDVFIPPFAVNGAMHKDNVLCRITRKESYDKKMEGEVIKILGRGMEDVVGTFEETRGFGFVVPDEKKFDQDIFIAAEDKNGAVTGHKVVVKITKWPEGRRNPEGRVTEILGHKNDPGVDILAIVYQYGLSMEFSREVLEQTAKIPEEISGAELAGREDFRNLITVTMDGEDAKDLDDAISLEILENGNYSLGVHIADVSHYVREGTLLDEEALLRGTSVYLVDRVIPMLPHKISNGICSLNPGVDRLALSCVMEVNSAGGVVCHRIVNSVIHSDRRMTYTAVKKILEDNDEETMKEYGELVPMFKNMEALCRILMSKREARGSVNFDLPESKIILDSTGKTIDILPYDRNIATRIIEEFMLLCNETVAEEYFWQETPFVFRNHEAPAEEKIPPLKEFLKNLGYRIKGKGELHPKAIQNVLTEAEGTMEEHIIHRTILRSMKRASYMAENHGHFGLASKYYCHFTSPIRRYPDLQIHRLIKENISAGFTDERKSYLNKRMPFVAKHSSVAERLAEEAERETDKLKKAEFMLDKIGNVYEGVISGMTSRGIFVELPNTVEGMVPIASLEEDFYMFDQEKMLISGRRTGSVYRLGDKIYVKVKGASKEERTVDFVIAGPDEE